MKSLFIALGTLVTLNSFAGVSYSNVADLSANTVYHKIVNAEYKLVPTKVVERKIPGCVEDNDGSWFCTERVVLESQPAIAVNVSYEDTTFLRDGEATEWQTFYFKLEDFSAEDVATLKNNAPSWKNPFSRVEQKFAKKNFELKIKNAKRTIQVVDVRKSDLCTPLESGAQDPYCVERLVYKTIKKSVKEVTVLKK